MEPWLTFSVGGGIYALPLGSVDGVDPRGVLARVPGAPRQVRGVVGRRGTLLPVVDLPRLLGQLAEAPSSGEWIVVIRDRARLAGIEVEGLPNVVDAATDEELPQAETVMRLDAVALLDAVEAAVAAP